MKTIDEIIAWNIYERLRALKMDQKELARQAKMNYEHLNKLLRGIGDKKISRLRKLATLAQILGTTEESLRVNREPEWDRILDKANRDYGPKPYTPENEASMAMQMVRDLRQEVRSLKERFEGSPNKDPLSSIPPRVWAAWNSDKTPKKAKQLAELFLTREKAILKEMDLSLGGLKAAEELLRWVHPPKPHLKD